jgi:hypothetical protein
MIPNELLQAYLETDYCVDDVDIVIKIHQRNPLLDQLLQENNATTWAFITSDNPRSQSLSDEENTRRFNEFQSLVKDMPLPYHLGYGKGQGDWPPEKSILIIGLIRDKATEFARRFEQNAIVFGSIGERAELITFDYT